MTKSEIVSYVMHSPENTNPAVLNSMLDSLPSGGSNIFEVNLNLIPSNGTPAFPQGTVTMDKTCAEILTAARAGKTIIGVLPKKSYGDFEVDMKLAISCFDYGDSEYMICGFGYGGTEEYNDQTYDIIVYISEIEIDGEHTSDTYYLSDLSNM